MTTAPSSTGWTWVRRLAVVVALVALGVALVETWDRSRGVPLASSPRLALAGLSLAAALLVAGRAWCDLVEQRPRRVLAGFLVAQLGKYVPGGVWQAVGQVEAAAQDGVARSRAAMAFLVMMVVQVVAGLVVAAPLAAIAEAPAWSRIVAGVAPLALVLLHRAWLLRIVRLLARWRRLAHLGSETVPSQRSILVATARMLAVFVLLGLALQLALPVAFDPAATVGLVAAHALAWVGGFLVVPLPAGLGAREGVLVLAAGWHADTGALLAASLLVRLLQIVTEGVLATGTRIMWRRPVERRGAGPDAGDGSQGMRDRQ